MFHSGIGVAVVMVVCIGFVIMLIVLGIVRVRNAQKGADQDEQEKGEWDKNGLTITVNPMDPDVRSIHNMHRFIFLLKISYIIAKQFSRCIHRCGLITVVVG